MKLGSLISKTSRDGILCVISQDLKKAVRVVEVLSSPSVITLAGGSLSMLQALENWSTFEPELTKISEDLNAGRLKNTFAVNEAEFHSALPRTWLFADGSAFIHHIKLVRKARNAALPETLTTVPLMYQGESTFLAAKADIPQVAYSNGTDFEGEVGVITDFVPMGISPEAALKKVRLIVLINDVSLRGLIPEELASGFGFFQSKPAKALSPFAVTVDELGESWKEGRVHLPLQVRLNNEFFGKANAGAMHFHFGQLIAHAARTRDLQPGTLIGSGTVSNEDEAMGSSCLVEKRTIEQIKTGEPKTPYMKSGDRISMEMMDSKGQSIFGLIDQTVKGQ